jgi:hypothetical protein
MRRGAAGEQRKVGRAREKRLERRTLIRVRRLARWRLRPANGI